MYRIRLYLVAAAFLVTAVSGNLTSASFGRRRGILPSCIVGSSRVSHRRHRQMRSGTPIALGGSSLSIRYPPSSVGLSSLATAVYLRVGSIDADSSSFELGRSQNYVSNSAAREALGMRGGATVAEGINNTHVEKDQGWMWCRFNGPAVPRSTENNVSNSATSAALAMRGGATMPDKAYVEDDLWWVWWYLALRFHCETWKFALLDLLLICQATKYLVKQCLEREKARAATALDVRRRQLPNWFHFQSSELLGMQTQDFQPNVILPPGQQIDYALPKMLLVAISALTASYLVGKTI